eukprot:3061747-Karenia_brevis.AAC.1
MKPSETPFFAEDHKLADSCRPQNYGHYVECPYCKFTFGPRLDLYKDGKFVGQHLVGDDNDAWTSTSPSAACILGSGDARRIPCMQFDIEPQHDN